MACPYWYAAHCLDSASSSAIEGAGFTSHGALSYLSNLCLPQGSKDS